MKSIKRLEHECMGANHMPFEPRCYLKEILLNNSQCAYTFFFTFSVMWLWLKSTSTWPRVSILIITINTFYKVFEARVTGQNKICYAKVPCN